MARPTSFRLPEQLLHRLEQQAVTDGTTITTLVSTLLDEGLKTREFSGIVYRDGPTGRRAGLVGGPDVWEIVRAVQQAPDRGENRIRQVAEECQLPASLVRLAVDFYTVFPEEVDARIAADDRAAERVRELIERRERLLSP